MVLSLILWCICISSPILLFIGGLLCFFLDTSTQMDSTLKIISYVLWSLSVLSTCVILSLRKKIHLAIGIIKTSSIAFNNMPMITFLPVIQMVFYFVMVVPWCVVLVYLATVKVEGPELEGMPDVTNFVYSKGVRYGYVLLSRISTYIHIFLLDAYSWYSYFTGHRNTY